MGLKRDRQGNEKPDKKGPPAERNAFTPMFEQFRDELDEHHDRRERIVKVSRDVTALSKKIIFSLQRVRQVGAELPGDVGSEVQSRLAEVARLLASVAPDVQGLNRWRYLRNMSCIDELIEALTFAHYLRTQTLMSVNEVVAAVCELSAARGASDDAPGAAQPGREPTGEAPLRDVPRVRPTEDDFLMGVFDLSGEMMRFATTTTALTGRLPGVDQPAAEDGATATAPARPRTIVVDMQDLGSFFEMLPQRPGKQYSIKMETLRASVLKVEKLGYGITVRGSERPKGWMPDMKDEELGSP